MAGLCSAVLMAMAMMLPPCSSAYFTAALHASFTCGGAGCHAGGPCTQPCSLLIPIPFAQQGLSVYTSNIPGA
jgi:hypothetical protein